MARKFPFEFDFNEDADPVDEFHRLRVATAKHFKTLDAIMEYHRSLPSIKELIADLDDEIAKKKAKNTVSKKVKTNKKPTRQRKPAKRLTHT